ncbi:hypothetical protein FACS1894172_21080 [Spirochaetia bacterium]|nr:hypothetical protein FACS1894164_02810 [Spirochaetia bacterium]GHU37601.1 hypothetical protein FACS1894172_21080 [Spirochaetia bacterium]
MPCVASAWNPEDFRCHEEASRNAPEDARLLLGFGVHPQLPAHGGPDTTISLETMEQLASEHRLDAVGETGFDLYDAWFRESEPEQDRIFARHIEIAHEHGLPLVIHVRRALHKIFAASAYLKKLPAVIFHSWPGTPGDGDSLLKRGINAFFSFGNALVCNHKQAIRSAALLPLHRILLETDAPYQPRRDCSYSYWTDLPVLGELLVQLRRENTDFSGSADDMTTIIDSNFFRAFTGTNHTG